MKTADEKTYGLKRGSVKRLEVTYIAKTCALIEPQNLERKGDF